MDFGERIKNLRNEKKVTQQKLAEYLGVGRATIAGYETKGKQPSYEILTKIADYFNVSADYLLGRVDGEELNRDDFYKLNHTAEDADSYNAPKLKRFKDQDEFKDIYKLNDDSKKNLKIYIEFLKTREKQLKRASPPSPDNNRDHDDFEI